MSTAIRSVLRLLLLPFAGFVAAPMQVGAVEVEDPSTAPNVRLRQSVEYLSSLGSRVVGYPGCELAADYIETEFRSIGLEGVKREQFDVVVPIDRGAQLTLTRTGERFELQSLWPNEVRTPTLPVEGYESPLVYAGDGLFAQLPAVLQGRVLLMEFNSGRRWLDAAALGVRAVIFIEPQETSFTQSREKSASTPLDLPRFWIDRKSGLRLRQLIESGNEVVRLTARMDWEARPAWNILGWVGGSTSELGQDTVAVEAYYDAASVVPAVAPGAEASMGIAALLEVARHLRAHPPERRVLLLATTSHFQSRQGMGDFLRRHARRHSYYAERLVEPIDIDLFIGLDLSSGSDQLGLWNNTYDTSLTRFYAPVARLVVGHGKQVASALGLDPDRALVNGVSPLKGIGWSSYMPEPIVTDGWMATDAGLPALSFVTVLDARLPVGTPLDRVSGVTFSNLYRQVALLKQVLGRSLADPGLLDIDADLYKALADNLRDLRILTQRFPRRSQVPDEAVAGAIIALRRYFNYGEKFRGLRPQQPKGVNPTRMYLTDDNGTAYVPSVTVGARYASAYLLDPTTGTIVMAPDLSGRAEAHHGKPTGSGALPLGVRWSEPVDHTIVLFPTTAQEVYSMVHPGSLRMLRAPTIVAASGAAPRQFGYSLAHDDDELAGVLFGAAHPEEKDRLKILIGGVLLVNSQGSDSEESARGIGYLPSEGPLTRMGLRSARDMWLLDEYRLETLRTHAIENIALERLHEEGRRMIDRAAEAEQAGDWDRYMAATRAALGVEAKAYPKILSTLNDVIKGIIFFLALLIPAAFFAERLLFAAADIRRQLLGFGGLMLLIWTVMSLVHPAFELAHPLVIVLAFSIMAMAAFVMSLVGSRFNRYMVESRNRAAGIHTADFSRFGAAYVAFMLGISNMRRRKLRTALTLTTISLLTFSVLSFSSFEDRVRFLSFALDEPAEREGLLIRNAGWWRLNPPMLDFARSHFGDSGVVAPRNDILPFDENRLPSFVEVISGNRRAKAWGFLGLAPQEDSISRFGERLMAGSFFEQSNEPSCLLSDEMADNLGIEAEAVGRASVRILGTSLLVRGIYSSTAVDELHDLDGGSLMPIDYSQSAFSNAAGSSTTDAKAEAKPAEGGESGVARGFHHLAAADVAVLPYETLRSFGGELRSVAVGFEADVDGQTLIEAFLSRIDTDLYVGLRVDGGERLEAFRYTSFGLTSVQGLGALLIPFLMAVLIILNAMLGAVYERFREIGIYSSVGLAPVHISFLFLAEACVFAVLGVTVGYVVGQACGKLLLALDLLQGVELNYSSSAGVTAAVLVMAVVLLSTLYPARVAANLAVPDTVRRWKPPPPDGDEWRFPFPFNISQADAQGAGGFLFAWFDAFSGAAAGSFYTENVRLSRSWDGDESGVPTWHVDFDMWLSPYDLGVAQAARIEFAPTETPGMYAIEMTLVRSSGEPFHWRRLNPRFFSQLRKQLLIWNTLEAGMRQTHDEAAAVELEKAETRVAEIVEPVADVAVRYAERFPQDDGSERPSSPFSMRGICIGALLSLIIAVGATYATIVIQGTWMTVNASAPAALFLFVIVTVVINVLFAAVGPRFVISRADLVLIYAMMLVAASVPNLNYVGYLIPIMVGVFYFDAIEAWRPFFPEWLIIGDAEAATKFYEGLLPGQTIPWGEWLSPLGHWSAFFLALSFMMICMSVILHRQWSTHERLDYPMAQVPLQMIESPSSSSGPFSQLAPLFHNRWMWIGFAVPSTLVGLEGLRSYYPAVPTLDLSFYTSIFSDTGGLNFSVNYAWIGFSYLVNLDISLSIWVFFLVSKLQDSILSTAGIASTEKLSSYAYQASADPAHQGMGACVVFVLYGLWVGRRHFKDVLLKAWRPDRGIDDSEEVLSYRTAVLGFLSSLVFVGAWLWNSGMPLVVLPLFLACCLIFYVMITRVIATAGIATARSPMIASFVVISTMGSSMIGAKGIVALALTYPWQAEMRIFPMIACANSLKLAETVRGPKRRLFWAMALALVISVVGATVMFIYVAYDHGAVNLQNFFMSGLAQRPYVDLKVYFLKATYPNIRGLIFTGVGGVVEGLLIAAQHRLHWWPLHPLGFVIGNGWLTHSLWFSVCLAWLLKYIIMKYGGMARYLASRPFFIGMILGQATASGVWLIVNGLAGRMPGWWHGYM